VENEIVKIRICKIKERVLIAMTTRISVWRESMHMRVEHSQIKGNISKWHGVTVLFFFAGFSV
jgi:hypothetical protein